MLLHSLSEQALCRWNRRSDLFLPFGGLLQSIFRLRDNPEAVGVRKQSINDLRSRSKESETVETTRRCSVQV